MPFFQGARHFQVNGPDGRTDNGGPPMNGEDIERKVQLALQAADRAQSTSVNRLPAPSIGANSQYLSFSSGSSSFNGHMSQMSGKDKAYLDAQLAQAKRQLKEMDERRAQKRANGGRRKGGSNGASVNQGNSSQLPSQVLPTVANLAPIMDVPPMDHLPPPQMLDDIPPMSILPNPEGPNGDEQFLYPHPGQEYPLLPMVDPAQKYLPMESIPFQFPNTSIVNPLNPPVRNEEQKSGQTMFPEAR